FEKLARWLAPQHVRPCGRNQLVGWIGLPALELLHRQGSRKVGNVRFHPIRQRWSVELEAGPHRSRALVGRNHNVAHAVAPDWNSRHSRLMRLARLHLWTSVGPS